MAERQQRVLAAATAAVLALWAATMLLGFLPARVRLTSLEESLARRREAAAALAVRVEDLRRTGEEAARLRQEVNRREAALAARQGETALLARWHAAAGRAGVTITRVLPQNSPAPAEPLEATALLRLPLLLSAEGPREALLRFLSLLEEPRAGVLVEEISLSSQGAGDRWAAEMGLTVHAPR